MRIDLLELSYAASPSKSKQQKPTKWFNSMNSENTFKKSSFSSASPSSSTHTAGSSNVSFNAANLKTNNLTNNKTLICWYQSVRQEENRLKYRKKFDDEQAQQFIDWINFHFGNCSKSSLDNKILYGKLCIRSNLYEELTDGTRILYLLEVLYDVFLKKEMPITKLHKIKNFEICLDFMENRRKVKCVGINAIGLVEGNPKIILGLLFNIKHDHQIFLNKKYEIIHLSPVENNSSSNIESDRTPERKESIVNEKENPVECIKIENINFDQGMDNVIEKTVMDDEKIEEVCNDTNRDELSGSLSDNSALELSSSSEYDENDTSESVLNEVAQVEDDSLQLLKSTEIADKNEISITDEKSIYQEQLNENDFKYSKIRDSFGSKDKLDSDAGLGLEDLSESLEDLNRIEDDFDNSPEIGSLNLNDSHVVPDNSTVLEETCSDKQDETLNEQDSVIPVLEINTQEHFFINETVNTDLKDEATDQGFQSLPEVIDVKQMDSSNSYDQVVTDNSQDEDVDLVKVEYNETNTELSFHTVAQVDQHVNDQEIPVCSYEDDPIIQTNDDDDVNNNDDFLIISNNFDNINNNNNFNLSPNSIGLSNFPVITTSDNIILTKTENNTILDSPSRDSPNNYFPDFTDSSNIAILTDSDSVLNGQYQTSESALYKTVEQAIEETYDNVPELAPYNMNFEMTNQPHATYHLVDNSNYYNTEYQEIRSTNIITDKIIEEEPESSSSLDITDDYNHLINLNNNDCQIERSLMIGNSAEEQNFIDNSNQLNTDSICNTIQNQVEISSSQLENYSASLNDQTDLVTTLNNDLINESINQNDNENIISSSIVSTVNENFELKTNNNNNDDNVHEITNEMLENYDDTDSVISDISSNLSYSSNSNKASYSSVLKNGPSVNDSYQQELIRNTKIIATDPKVINKLPQKPPYNGANKPYRSNKSSPRNKSSINSNSKAGNSSSVSSESLLSSTPTPEISATPKNQIVKERSAKITITETPSSTKNTEDISSISMIYNIESNLDLKKDIPNLKNDQNKQSSDGKRSPKQKVQNQSKNNTNQTPGNIKKTKSNNEKIEETKPVNSTTEIVKKQVNGVEPKETNSGMPFNRKSKKSAKENTNNNNNKNDQMSSSPAKSKLISQKVIDEEPSNQIRKLSTLTNIKRFFNLNRSRKSLLIFAVATFLVFIFIILRANENTDLNTNDILALENRINFQI